MLAWHINGKTCKRTTNSAIGAIYGLLCRKDLRAVHGDNMNWEARRSNGTTPAR